MWWEKELGRDILMLRCASANGQEKTLVSDMHCIVITKHC